MTSEIDPGLTDSFARRKVPLVFLDVGKVGRGVSNIRIDYARGIAQAVEHLRELGHRRIAFISGPANLRSAWERREAFLERLSGRDNSQPEELLIEEGNHKVDGGLQAMLRLLERRPQPTAVLASNDLTAIGALRGIRQYGLRVPEDISVVGFDDIQMAEYTEPPLTTVRLQQSEVASLACNALLQLIRTPGMGSELGVSTSLVIRASTAPARPSV
jgi:LacI family transcriptional regulator